MSPFCDEEIFFLIPRTTKGNEIEPLIFIMTSPFEFHSKQKHLLNENINSAILYTYTTHFAIRVRYGLGSYKHMNHINIESYRHDVLDHKKSISFLYKAFLTPKRSAKQYYISYKWCWLRRYFFYWSQRTPIYFKEKRKGFFSSSFP